MKMETTILTGINNLKAQLEKVMTEASNLEVMIREIDLLFMVLTMMGLVGMSRCCRCLWTFQR
ncbi:hypothetical protein DW079_13750 [Segatella copri]|uniref:Uncharacterized protein n=1 Tax=Segatella copri TaxID=165179 RepID=A0A415EW83_9BACT|nr:hypothetical protein DW079_13750 [Segatella copri]